MTNESNAGTGVPPSLSEAMEQILAHPEWISSVASALNGSARAEVPREEPAREASDEAAASAPVEGEQERASTAPVVGEMPAVLQTLAPLLSAVGGGGASPGKPRERQEDPSANLLRALKPYVSHGRQEAIDYMIRISKISELVKHL